MGRLEDCVINDTLTLKVRPNAKKTAITDIKDNIIFLDVASAPEDNKANIEIIKFISRQMKKQVRFLRGKSSKTKVLKII